MIKKKKLQFDPFPNKAKQQPEVPTKPITPEMRNIMQSLANNMDAARRELGEREKQFSDYIAQCAHTLGLKPDDFDGFNIGLAAFVLKAKPEQTTPPTS